MALMSVKNLVYNELSRNNVFCFINSISILVVLTCCYHYSYFSFYYYYHYCFYTLLLLLYFLVIIVIISIVLSIINIIYFFFFHFISYCSYYYEFCLCVVCDVHEFPRIFSPFVVNDLYFILHLLINLKDYFPFATIVYVIIVIITIILFFSTLPAIG